MDSEKRLLLLGGGYAEIPLILAAQSLGYFVITVGKDEKGLGHPYADKNVFADYGDKEVMLELARIENVCAVCSGCNDFSLLSAAYVCEQLGLPGHDSYATSVELHHKDKYRALASRLRIPSPRAVTINDLDSFRNAMGIGPEASTNPLKFPVVVKPVDMMSGKGVRRADNIEEAIDACEEATRHTRESRIVVEEFVPGTNHGFSCFLIDGRVAFYFADNEFYYLNKYMVGGENTPSATSEAGLQLLCEYSEWIASELHLVNGILHIQYIERDDGTPVIIEICRRPPGDLYVKLVQYATGVDYSRAIILAETGDVSMDDLLPEDHFKKAPECWLCHCIMPDRSGRVLDVNFDDEIEINVVEKFIWFKLGELVTDPLTFKAGIVFMRFESIEEMNDKTGRINQLIKLVMSDH